MTPDIFSDRNERGEPQFPQNVLSTPGDDLWILGASPIHLHWVSSTPTYVVIGAEHCRRQLSQWQFTQAWTGVSISNLMAPHKQRPRIIGLLGNIPSFEARAVWVAAKYASKVNIGDNFVILFRVFRAIPEVFFLRLQADYDERRQSARWLTV